MKNILAGLMIISRYEPNGNFAADHDEIWAGHKIAQIDYDREDVMGLQELGWNWDEAVGGWHHFT